MSLTRRAFLSQAGLWSCSAAASPFLTPVAYAAAPGENRLVVIILRGAMDGLDVIRPADDPAYAQLRPLLAAGAVPDLVGRWGLHPALASLRPLWEAGEFGAVHAVSTPYRDRRSHFDGQDILEAGTVGLAGEVRRDGWLNRMMQVVAGVTPQTAYAIGREQMLILSGRAEVARWAPDSRLLLSPAARSLMEMVTHDDPLFRAATAEALAIVDSLALDADMPLMTGAEDDMQEGSGMDAAGNAMADGNAYAMSGGNADANADGNARANANAHGNARANANANTNANANANANGNGNTNGNAEAAPATNTARRAPHIALAEFAVSRLQRDSRICSFSLGGWDTHGAQSRTMVRPLEALAETILALQSGMGPLWGQTSVLCMTEFGRTVRENGSGGTDHGTGGVMLYAGGAMRGGQVAGDWPGLRDLYADRDLLPTRDLRAHAGWIMRGLFGVSQAAVEDAIFPGVELGADPGLLR